MLDLLPILALGLGLGLAWLICTTMHSLARPMRRTAGWAVARSRPSDPSELSPARRFETIEFKYNAVESGPVWLIDGDDPAGPVVIFSHGWGESRIDVLQRIGVVAPFCSRIIAWDLPGHGESPRGSSPLGTSEWMQLADLVELAQGEDLDALEREAEAMEASSEDEADWDAFFDAPPKPGAPRVVLWGYSLGAGVSIDLAANRSRRVAAIIAESPYRLAATPARNMLTLKRLPWRINLGPAMFLLGLSRGRGPRWTGFDRASLARDVECPLLVVHGEEDEICPIGDGSEIAECAGIGSDPDATARPRGGAFVPLPAAGHFDLWTDPSCAAAREIATEAIRGLIRGISGRGPDPDPTAASRDQ